MFLFHVDVSLPLSPSLPLSLKSISMSSGEDKKIPQFLVNILLNLNLWEYAEDQIEHLVCWALSQCFYWENGVCQ